GGVRRKAGDATVIFYRRRARRGSRLRSRHRSLWKSGDRLHRLSRLGYSAGHRSLGAAGSAGSNERGARRFFEGILGQLGSELNRKGDRSMPSTHIAALRALLEREKGVLVPGAPNALAARIIADLGFKAVYLTGAGLTNMHLGLPDLGFMDLSQVADHVMAIRCVIDLPLIVDVDTGRQDLVVIARTDACAVEGFEAAIERAGRYIEAGADVTFVEAPESLEDLKAVPHRLKAPQLVNMVLGGKTPIIDEKAAAEMGFSLVLYANAALQGAVHGMQSTLSALKEKGVLDERAVTSFAEPQRLVDKQAFDLMEARYAAHATSKNG